MGQFNWTYLGDNGKKFKVGLFHGPRTGHLLIHCNSRIVQVDFGVRETTTYSFFLDEELCEIELERIGNKFQYRFNINKTIDTPRNRARKRTERKHWKQSLLFFGLLLFCAGLFASWFIYQKNHYIQKEKMALLEKQGMETAAKVFLDTGASGNLRYQYSFVANGKNIASDWHSISSPYLSNGMPLESGDEFLVRFARNRPFVHEINFDKPTNNQLQEYFQQAFNLHQQLHPNLPRSRIRCQLRIAYELKGVSGLADFYFQKVPESDNPNHNISSYLRLIRDVPFQKNMEEKCL